MENNRAVTDVEGVLNLAKIETADTVSFSQPLYFTNKLIDKNKFRILEVPLELADSLSQGRSLVLKGEENENVVVCNDVNTYDIKEAETSNSFLLLNTIAYEELKSESENKNSKKDQRILLNSQIKGCFNTYLELSQCTPKTYKIRSLLEQPHAKYDEVSSRWNPKVGIAMSEIEDKVQCSKQELQQALDKIQAIRVSQKTENYVDYHGERVFLIKNDYKMKVLTLITDFIQRDIELINSRKSNDSGSSSLWEGGIERDRCIRMCNLDDEPSFIVEQIFDYFFTPSEFSCTVENMKYNPVISYKVCKEKVYKFCGECLFPDDSSSQGSYGVEEFCSVWQGSVDIHFGSNLIETCFDKVDISRDLKGLALLDSKDNKIVYLPEWKLPLDIQERFQTLFKYREKWSLQDMTPYIESFITKKTNAYALISKYSRVITDKDGSKLFCSRYRK